MASGNNEEMAATVHSLPSRYALPELVAHGGMADVYRASDERLGRVVAIKVLAERYARQPEFRKRFLREAQTAATLTGEPNVVAIYDVGETTDGIPFIVMEYASDGTVADRLRAGPRDPDEAMRWLAQTAGALDAAHARGIVHRDVKPANLLVASDGAIRVSDFGIARAAGDDTLTAAGTILGSFGYMAPEQARGEPTTAATDRYALACVAFELLTGRRPFERESMTAEAAAHVNDAPPSVRELAPQLPAALDSVFARGLAKVPSERHTSCADLVADLRAALGRGDTVVAPAPAAADVATQRIVRHSARRSPAALVGVAALLLAAGGGLAWALTQDGGEGAATVVLTETLQGRTVERTVTESDTVVVTETASTQGGDGGGNDGGANGGGDGDGSVGGQSGAQLNDRGFRLLQAGDVEGALPVLESAVSLLSGSSSLAEAYASYNLAAARFGVGRCDGVADLLDRSEEVQGKRKEIDRLRKQVERRCDVD